MKAEAKEKHMPYDPYSRVNQQILEGTLVGVSLYLAFLIRYEGAIPPYNLYQFWALLLPFIMGRLLTNYALGLHKIQWRYIGFHDALLTSRVYFAFSCVLLLMRFGLAVKAGILRIPASVIIIELLLSLLGAMAIRLARRHVYELQSRRAISVNSEGPRRLLL